ncbi:MAG TPA: hypothetical protein VK447_21370 [Myxococcaceae bacterium]|nr:hypothetical protein [Myxococcaceae bacterium]
MKQRDTLALLERAAELDQARRERRPIHLLLPVHPAEEPLGSFLQQVLREVARANASFETHQRECWEHIARMLPVVDGVDLAEGLGSQLSLAVKETQLTFWLETAPPGFFRKIMNRLRGLMGKPVPLLLRFYRPDGHDAMKVVVTLVRKQDGSFTLRHEETKPAAPSSLQIPALPESAPRSAGA